MNQLCAGDLRFRTFSAARSLREIGDASPGAGQALLRTRINRIDTPLVHVERRTAQRSHRIGDDHAPVVACDARECLSVRKRAGGRFRLDERYHPRVEVRLKRMPRPCRG